MYLKVSWLFAVFFGLALAGATLMNVTLVNQARGTLEMGGLAGLPVKKEFQYHVALVIPDSQDAFFDGLTASIEEAAIPAGAAVQIFRYRVSVPEDEETYFQICISSHVDGIILYSAADAQTKARRTRATAEGVVFIPIGTQVPRGNTEGFIGSSSLLQGIESGNQATAKIGNSARIGILLTAGDEAPEADPTYLGVELSLESYPNARILLASRARPGILSGEEAASALLKADPSINVLICASAPITEGAAQVVVDQGRVGRILIVGTDESPTIDRLVDKGVIAATVVRDSNKMGAEAIKAFTQGWLGGRLHSVEVGFKVRKGGLK